jgi:hypothetical protein
MGAGRMRNSKEFACSTEEISVRVPHSLMFLSFLEENILE